MILLQEKYLYQIVLIAQSRIYPIHLTNKIYLEPADRQSGVIGYII